MASHIVPPAVDQSESAVISNRLEAYRTDHQTKHPFVVQFPAPQTITQSLQHYSRCVAVSIKSKNKCMRPSSLLERGLRLEPFLSQAITVPS